MSFHSFSIISHVCIFSFLDFYRTLSINSQDNMKRIQFRGILLLLQYCCLIARAQEQDQVFIEEQVTTEPVLCPSWDEPYFPDSYLEDKVYLARNALRSRDLKTLLYNWAKLDETPIAGSLLKSIIGENYTSQDFTPALEFIANISDPSLRLKGYDVLLDSIMGDANFSMARGELFHVAHLLKSKVSEFDPDEFLAIINRFSQGIKATVFESHFSIKNIHDSYVFHFKARSSGGGGGGGGEEENPDHYFWYLTGKCKRCNESHLVATPANEQFSLFSINNPHLGHNCLGVKNAKAILWQGQEDHDEFCERERWHIRFVGKTLAIIIYQPKGSNVTTEEVRGFALTRVGFNKKVTLESAYYLNSNQIWLTT